MAARSDSAPIPSTRLATHLLHRRTLTGTITWTAALLRLHVAHSWTPKGDGTLPVLSTFSGLARWIGFSESAGLDLRKGLMDGEPWGIRYSPDIKLLELDAELRGSPTSAPTVPRDCVRTILARLALRQRADAATISCFVFLHLLGRAQSDGSCRIAQSAIADAIGDASSIRRSLTVLAEEGLIMRLKPRALGRGRGAAPELITVLPPWSPRPAPTPASDDLQRSALERIAFLEEQLAATKALLGGINPGNTPEQPLRNGVSRSITTSEAEIAPVAEMPSGVPRSIALDHPIKNGNSRPITALEGKQSGIDSPNANRTSPDSSVGKGDVIQEEGETLPPPPPGHLDQNRIDVTTDSGLHAAYAILESNNIRLELTEFSKEILSKIPAQTLNDSIRGRHIESLWDIRVALDIDGHLGDIPLDGPDIRAAIAAVDRKISVRMKEKGQEKYAEEWAMMFASCGLRLSGVMDALRYAKQHAQGQMTYAREAEIFVRPWSKEKASIPHVIKPAQAARKLADIKVIDRNEPKKTISLKAETLVDRATWLRVVAAAVLPGSTGAVGDEDLLEKSIAAFPDKKRRYMRMFVMPKSVQLHRQGDNYLLVAPDEACEQELRHHLWIDIKRSIAKVLGGAADLVVGATV